jgi:hypothetical protein
MVGAVMPAATGTCACKRLHAVRNREPGEAITAEAVRRTAETNENENIFYKRI